MMTPRTFVSELSKISLPGVFNPYKDRCDEFDLVDAPRTRRVNLRNYLGVLEALGPDTIWMGRDLGYRGGRRTGLALTDEQHLDDFSFRYPGSRPVRATRGPVVAERTAAEIWGALRLLKQAPLLWNVFPFHPHEEASQLSNRKFTMSELAVVTELNHALITWLGIRRIICIGQDAAKYATSFGVDVECIRHPSYGGIKDFRAGVYRLYGNEMNHSDNSMQSLFQQ